MASELDIKNKIIERKAWENGGDADSILDKIVSCIRESTREVLGVSRGRTGKHQGDGWWNEELKEKVEAKKRAYAKLAESKDKKDKRKNKEYKIAR